MPFKSKHRIVTDHALAIVGNLEQAATATLNIKRDAGGASINRILDSSLATDAGRSTTSPAAI